MNIGAGWHVGLEFIPAAVVVAIISFVVGKASASRWATASLPIIGALAGTAIGLEAVRVTGYVADYSFAGVWAVSVVFVATALVMVPFHALRRGGLIALLTGASVLTGFYVVVMSAEFLGLTAQKAAG